MKKLSKKERGELVTKGFLEDSLKIYVTKDYLDTRLEELSKKITKEISTDFRQHLDTLMEHQIHQLEVLMEQMDERYVLRRKWKAENSLSV